MAILGLNTGEKYRFPPEYDRLILVLLGAATVGGLYYNVKYYGWSPAKWPWRDWLMWWK